MSDDETEKGVDGGEPRCYAAEFLQKAAQLAKAGAKARQTLLRAGEDVAGAALPPQAIEKIRKHPAVGHYRNAVTELLAGTRALMDDLLGVIETLASEAEAKAGREPEATVETREQEEDTESGESAVGA